MPLFTYECPPCGTSERRLLDASQRASQSCSKCGCALQRVAKAPSTQVIEALDNGIMPRRLERLRDAEELYRERAKSDPRNTKV